MKNKKVNWRKRWLLLRISIMLTISVFCFLQYFEVNVKKKRPDFLEAPVNENKSASGEHFEPKRGEGNYYAPVNFQHKQTKLELESNNFDVSTPHSLSSGKRSHELMWHIDRLDIEISRVLRNSQLWNELDCLRELHDKAIERSKLLRELIATDSSTGAFVKAHINIRLSDELIIKVCERVHGLDE